MSESAATAQPVVIKDVQTLKANLKEQEKRARSENELEEVVPIPDQQPPAQHGGEKRKRRKVSNPQGPPINDSEAPVLDGPLPPTKSTEPIETSHIPPPAHCANAAHPIGKDASAAAPVSTSPAKATESTAKTSNSDTATAPSVENDQTMSAVVSPSPEVTKEPVTSKDDELKAQETAQEKTLDELAPPKAMKEGAIATPAAQESAPKSITKPAETVEVAAS